MSQTDFKNEVCDRMSVFINCNSADFYLEVKSYATFSAMRWIKPIDSSDNFIDPGTFDFGQASTSSSCAPTISGRRTTSSARFR